jgi:enoyl-CoA hydratase/carnithine racemase
MTTHPVTDARYSRYEVADRVAAITIDRPQKANAQNERLLDELDACFDAATVDPDVGVVVLRAVGKHFSAGHDLEAGGPEQPRLRQDDGSYHLQDIYRWEAQKYLGYALKWRNIPKPTIAAVQGRCIAGALNLVFPMDLIVAAENAQFEDPVVAMAIGGVEYHGHTWELGARRAKDLLFTGRAVGAAEAERIGLVREVVPLDELWDRTMDLARAIARKHPFGLAQAKRAVNQTLDVQGFYAAVQAVFDIHHTGHGNALSISGQPILVGLSEMKAQLGPKPNGGASSGGASSSGG